MDTISETYRERVRQSLLENYFAGLPQGYLDSTCGKTTLEDHISGRYRIAKDHVVPWVKAKFDLSGMSVIEIGSGTGSSTLAMAPEARSVDCYEINESASAVAQERLNVCGISNVRLHSALFDEQCEFVQHGGLADAILLYATLEHMTSAECLSILALTWRVLRPGGILIVAETPNRLSIIDEHTSHLPFFSQLPRDIQVLYAARSPREDFREGIADARKESPESGLEAMTRWGSGISYHEFELALGADIHNHIVLDGYECEITRLLPASRIDTNLQAAFTEFRIPAHRAFTRRSLYLTLQKPDAARNGRLAPSNWQETPDPAPWKSIRLPDEVTRIPSMSTFEEQQHLTWLAEKKYQGWGAIVEVGCWLGAGTAALAEGLRRRGPAAKVQSFDLFQWQTVMSQTAGPVLHEGDDFLPLFLEHTAPYSQWIEAHRADLFDCHWGGGPIEILLIDSAKTWDEINAVLKQFAQHLVPGRSRIVLQDFRFPYAHCLPLIFDSRPDIWKEVENIAEGSTVAFMPLKPFGGIAGESPQYSDESFPIESADHLLRRRIATEGPWGQRCLWQTLYRKYLIDGPLPEALVLRAQILAMGVDEKFLALAEQVGHILSGRGWTEFERGDYQTARALAERCSSIPGQESSYSLALLGFSLLHLGETAGAAEAVAGIRNKWPDFLVGRMLSVELALAESRQEEAEAEVLAMLQDLSPSDEHSLHWAVSLLTRAWSGRGTAMAHTAALGALAERFPRSPTFLTHWAVFQFEAGQKEDALANIARALEVAPDFALAQSYRMNWTGESS